jgi:hypothetical protein
MCGNMPFDIDAIDDRRAALAEEISRRSNPAFGF